MRHLFILVFIIITISTLAGQQLRGVVLDRSANSSPAEGVKLTFLTGGANGVATNSSGSFAVTMSGVEAGDPIEIIVQKNGFVLLGPDETIFRTNMPGDDTPIRLAVASRKAFDNLKADYVSGIEKRLRRAEDERQVLIDRMSTDSLAGNERTALAKTISEQSREIKNLRKNKEELAQRLARIDLDETSEFAREALQKFQEEGDVTAALELMTEEKLEAFWGNVLAQEEKVKWAKEQGVENWMIRARLLMADFRFGEAEKAFERAVKLDTNNFKNSFEYAFFLTTQNQFGEAIKLYENLIRLNISPSRRAVVANNLGNLYNDIQRLGRAEEKLQSSIRIYRKLILENRMVYLPGLGRSLNNLGLSYYKMQRLSEAEEVYKKAIDIYRELLKLDRKTHLLGLAGALTNLGNSCVTNQRLDEAEILFSEALEYYRELATDNSKLYLSDVTATLNNIGILYRRSRRFNEAHEVFTESVNNSRQLVAKNESAYLPLLAKSLNNLGVLHTDNKNYIAAEKAHDSVIVILRNLVIKDRAAYLPDLARSLNNIGILYRTSQRYDEAEIVYIETVEIGRELVASNRKSYLPDLARSLNNLGNLYRSSLCLQKAGSTYNEAIKNYRELIVYDRETHILGLAISLDNLGTLYKLSRQFTLSLNPYEESLALHLESLLQGQAFIASYLGKGLNNVTDTRDSMTQRKEYSNALRAQQIITDTWEKLIVLDEDFNIDIAEKQGILAHFALFAQNYPTAKTAALRALELQPEATWVNTNLALAELFLGNRNAAEALYKKYKDQPYPNDAEGRTFRYIFLADLAELAAAGITPDKPKEVQRWLE